MVTGGMGSVLGRLVLMSVPLPIGIGAPVEPGAFGSVTSGIGRRVTAGSLDSAGAVGFVPLNGGGIVRSSSSSFTSDVAGSVDAGAVGSVVLNSGGIRRPSSSSSSVSLGAGSVDEGSVGFVPLDGEGIRRSSSPLSDSVGDDSAGADSVDADAVGSVPFAPGIRLSTALETRDSTGSMIGSRMPVPEGEPSVTLGISVCSVLGAVGLFEGETGVTSTSLDDAASVDDSSSDLSVSDGAVGFGFAGEVVLTLSLDVSLVEEDESEDVSVPSNCEVTTPVGSKTMPVGDDDVVCPSVVCSLVLVCAELDCAELVCTSVVSSVVGSPVVVGSSVVKSSDVSSSSSVLEVGETIASEELVAGSVSVTLIRMVEESERVRMSSRSVRLREGVSERLGSSRGSVVERSESGNEVSGASERSSLVSSALVLSEDGREVSGVSTRSSLLNPVLISSESGSEVSEATSVFVGNSSS